MDHIVLNMVHLNFQNEKHVTHILIIIIIIILALEECDSQ